MKQKIEYRGFRYPPEIIGCAVWLYYRFTLSSVMLRICWLKGELPCRKKPSVCGVSDSVQATPESYVKSLIDSVIIGI